MPQRFEFDNIDSMKIYLNDLFSSIVLKDIIKRYNIKNVALFERVIEYLVTNPSQVFSTQNIMKASEYDIRGKRILSRKDKYYLTDLGLGQILNVNKKAQYGAYLENIVYNELVYRGYEVSIGNNNGKKIDLWQLDMIRENIIKFVML